VIEINYTLLAFQAVNFIVFLILFNAIIVKPMLKHLGERDGKVASGHEQAKENSDRAQAVLEDYEQAMASARSKASQAYNAAQDEGMKAHREKLAAARAEAQEIMDKAMADINSEADKARQTLKAEMETMPKEIAGKLLGRAV